MTTHPDYMPIQVMKSFLTDAIKAKKAFDKALEHSKGTDMEEYYARLSENKQHAIDTYSEAILKLSLEVRPQVIWFAKQMEIKLKLNDDKGGWDSAPINYLVKRLHDELKELEIELEKRDMSKIHHSVEFDPKDVIQECSDISNFAMMIADKVKGSL